MTILWNLTFILNYSGILITLGFLIGTLKEYDYSDISIVSDGISLELIFES